MSRYIHFARLLLCRSVDIQYFVHYNLVPIKLYVLQSIV